MRLSTALSFSPILITAFPGDRALYCSLSITPLSITFCQEEIQAWSRNAHK
ncbi:hypothetical protein [Planktothricoides raciborskii]|uniref:Uncharacterized protein n=1 Tax=Planktothricoides raciborskii FACHB-1370 TaxID=2949576 RepID=A0ABR8EM19_9CYAN|nr:hypothetical protein [Planktothricoides raciborskii]MBD2547688.1 hypothetical protein [Planktothricoides raciborskii FACHB-1370]MBD2586119.1 hypothetical protein [Planktothricoides raciborskii FACHB-1261]